MTGAAARRGYRRPTMRSPLASRVARVVAVVALLLVLVGCQADVEVTIDVAEDGSGVVTVAVGLDPDALARVPDLDAQLRTDDLAAAGWTVAEPEEREGRTWVRVSKPFEDPSQLPAIMAEISGPDGVFQEFELTRTHSFGSTSYELTGTVDLSQGVAVLGDAELAAALDGDPFGGNLELIEAEEGEPVTEMVTVTVSANLPGATSPAVVEPAFADTEPTTISAQSTVTETAPKIWVGVAAVCFLLAAMVPVRAAFRRRRA